MSTSGGGLRRFIRGKKSHFVWNDDREWGDVPSETYLDAIDRHAAERPDMVCVDCEGDLLTFGDYAVRSTRMANALRGLGVGRGETIVTVLDNSVDMILVAAAVARLGAIWVPVNVSYRGEFLRHQLADADARLAICDQPYLDNLLAIRNELPRIELIIVRDGTGAEVPDGLTSFEAIRGCDDTPLDVSVHPDDIACLIYTSGTTGPSKGCMISHDYLCKLGRRRNLSVVPEPGGVTWSCLPLYHIGFAVILVANLLVGERTAIARRFSVSGFWEEIERSGATSVIILASMFPLTAQGPDTPAMKRCFGQIKVVSGAPLSDADRKTWQERFGVRTMNAYAYGQTEANLVTFLPWGDPPPPFGSMGPPSADFDAMVVGDDGCPVLLGEVGELVVRPRQPGAMFSGFWRRPEDTLRAMKNLWWHTGDFVRMDADGYLYFVDRKKDYLRSRGENISSFEVESALMKHGALAEVVFHTVPGEAGVEEPIKATIILKEGETISELALFEWARDNLPYFALPRFIEFRAAMPKTPTGRVQKNVLRADGVTPGTWDCEAAGIIIKRGMAMAGRSDYRT